MRNKRVLRWTIAIVAVLLLFTWNKRRAAAKAADEEIPPETAQVERGEIRQTVVASGVIQPETLVEVKSNAGGEVTALFVDVGDLVQPGDLLARIDPKDSLTAVRTASADLSAAQQNVRQAAASAEMERRSVAPRELEALESVKSARARLRQAEENLLLAQSTSGADITNADEGLRSASARLDRANLSRQRDDQQLEVALTDAEMAEIEAAARHAQAAANLNYQREQYEADVARAAQAVAAAEARLRIARSQAQTRPATAAASVREAEASLASSRQQLARLETATLAENAAGVRGEFESSRVLLANAEADLRRQRELYDKGYVPKSAVEQAEVDYAAARGRFEVAEQAQNNLGRTQTADLEQARADVRRAEAALDRAQQSEQDAGTAALDLVASEAAYEEARADQRRAAAGASQIDIRERELEAAAAALTRAGGARRSAEARRVEPTMREADLTEADVARQQARIARDRAFANQRNVAIREAELSAAKSALSQAEASYRRTLAQRGQIVERSAAVGVARASIARREAELSNAQEQLDDTTIVAPRAGVVIERFVEEGSIITSGRSSIAEGTRIMTIADITQLYCNAEVDEADVARVQTNQRATLKVEAYPEAEFAATVRKVFPQGVEESDVTLFTVELAVQPGKQLLRPGMTAEIEIETLIKPDVLTIPSEAVREGPQGFYVMVDDPAAEEALEVPVKVGIQTFDKVEIVDGLTEGQEIIVSLGGPPEEANGAPGGPGGRDGAQRQMQRSMRMMTGPPGGRR